MNQRTKVMSVALALLGGLFVVSCNSNPVELGTQTSSVLGFRQQGGISAGAQLDILWVIDNSGSMSEEQASLNKNFGVFIKALAETNIDFHLAVTTTERTFTERESSYNLSKKSDGTYFSSGELRSYATPLKPQTDSYSEEPEVLVGMFNRMKGCLAEGEITTDFPADLAMTTAIEKYAAVSKRFRLGESKEFCKKIGETTPCSASSGDLDTEKGKIAKFFNAVSSKKYRDFGPFLKRNDYLKGGELDTDSLKKAFSCISLVGNGGYGIEQGLQAAVDAVSEEMLQGANKGFIREKAKFVVIFVTDENDCSLGLNSDGMTFSEAACAGMLCELFNAKGIPDDKNPLVSISALKEKLISNLRTAKGYTDDLSAMSDADKKKTMDAFAKKNMIVASIHGRPRRIDLQNENLFNSKNLGTGQLVESNNPYKDMDNDALVTFLNTLLFTPSGPKVQNQALYDSTYEVKPAVCAKIPYFGDRAGNLSPSELKLTEKEEYMTTVTCDDEKLGRATSGDRYERFINEFPVHYPIYKGRQGALMCQDSFAAAFKGITDLFKQDSTGCIAANRRQLYGCGEGVKKGEKCGPEELGGVCTEVPRSGSAYYCSSAIVAYAVAQTKDQLSSFAQEYCLFDANNNIVTMDEVPNSCILNSKVVEFGECDGATVAGLQFRYKNLAKAKIALQGAGVFITYTAYAKEEAER